VVSPQLAPNEAESKSSPKDSVSQPPAPAITPNATYAWVAATAANASGNRQVPTPVPPRKPKIKELKFYCNFEWYDEPTKIWGKLPHPGHRPWNGDVVLDGGVTISQVRSVGASAPKNFGKAQVKWINGQYQANTIDWGMFFAAEHKPCTIKIHFQVPCHITHQMEQGNLHHTTYESRSFPLMETHTMDIRTVRLHIKETHRIPNFTPVCVASFPAGHRAYNPKIDDKAYVSRELELINLESEEARKRPKTHEGCWVRSECWKDRLVVHITSFACDPAQSALRITFRQVK
jgi:hypothetical protein